MQHLERYKILATIISSYCKKSAKIQVQACVRIISLKPKLIFIDYDISLGSALYPYIDFTISILQINVIKIISFFK